MNLYDIWISHLNMHSDASIECEICLRGDYKEAHECVLINLNSQSYKCEDFLIPEMTKQRFDVKSLMECQQQVSLGENYKDSSHFFYFISLVLDKEASSIARSIRLSTTNRYSTEVPGHDLIRDFQIQIPVNGLYRGIRVDEKTFNQFNQLNVNDLIPLKNHVMSMTELVGRGIDYSYRKRPLDPEFVNFGIFFSLSDFQGLPISSLSTYPVEREWRVLGEFQISKIVKDTSPAIYNKMRSDWVLTDWNEPVEHMSKWSVISLRGRAL